MTWHFVSRVPAARFSRPCPGWPPARAHAVRPHLCEEPSRPGAVLDRPRIHGGCRGRLLHGLATADPEAAYMAAGPHRNPGRQHRPLSRVRHRRVRPAGRAPAAVLTHTRFGSQLRAAVADPLVAPGLGVSVGSIFALTFSTGSGLARRCRALGTALLRLDP